MQMQPKLVLSSLLLLIMTVAPLPESLSTVMLLTDEPGTEVLSVAKTIALDGIWTGIGTDALELPLESTDPVVSFVP